MGCVGLGIGGNGGYVNGTEDEVYYNMREYRYTIDGI